MFRIGNILRSVPVVGRLFGGALGKATKEGAEAMTKAQTKIYNGLIKSHDPKTMGALDDLVKERYKAIALDGAEAAKGGWLGRIAAGLGITGAAVGVGAIGEAAIYGENSRVRRGLENLMEAGKEADAVSDLKGFFERIKEFFRQIGEFLRDPSGYIAGTSTPNSANASGVGSTTNNTSGTPPSPGNGVVTTNEAALTGAGVAGTTLAASAGWRAVGPSSGVIGGAGRAILGGSIKGSLLRAGIAGGAAFIGAQTGVISPEITESVSSFVSDLGSGLGDVVTGNWEWSDAGNLVNSTAHGAATGITSSVSWVGGQALDILNVGNIFSDRDFSSEFSAAAYSAVDGAWANTVGAPDLSGAWSQALNFGGSVAAPIGIGGLLVKAFANSGRIASATAKTANVGIQVGAPSPT